MSHGWPHGWPHGVPDFLFHCTAEEECCNCVYPCNGTVFELCCILMQANGLDPPVNTDDDMDGFMLETETGNTQPGIRAFRMILYVY